MVIGKTTRPVIIVSCDMLTCRCRPILSHKDKKNHCRPKPKRLVSFLLFWCIALLAEITVCKFGGVFSSLERSTAQHYSLPTPVKKYFLEFRTENSFSLLLLRKFCIAHFQGWIFLHFTKSVDTKATNTYRTNGTSATPRSCATLSIDAKVFPSACGTALCIFFTLGTKN